jgi:hypothetical protein
MDLNPYSFFMVNLALRYRHSTAPPAGSARAHEALLPGFLTRQAGSTVKDPGGTIQDGQRFLEGKSSPFLQICQDLYDLFRRLQCNVGPDEKGAVLF